MAGNQTRVLIIEDETEIREFLVSQLEENNIRAMGLPSGDEVSQALEVFKPHAILLDQMMPGKTGRELIREIRAHIQFAEIPIMMVTGLDAETEKVESLTEGADDYVTKPFSIREIIARINALIRRSQVAHRSQQKSIVFRELTVDLIAHQALLNGQALPLTLTEFKILVELLQRCGQVLTRDRLRAKALGNLNVTDRTIDVHMASLRKKLEGLGDCIDTVRGVGYRLLPDKKKPPVTGS